MKLLLISLLALIPPTAHAESRGGFSGGGIGMPHMGSRMSPPHMPSYRGQQNGFKNRRGGGIGKHRFERRMVPPGSLRLHGLRSRLIWPWYNYAPVPEETIVSVQIQEPEPPPPPLKPPAPAKFWIEQCGVFVELDVGPDTNLMQEEQKDCAQ